MTPTGSTPAQRFGSLAAPLACGCCLVAGATYIAAQNPSDGGVFIPCPFRVLTGWWCPGCGLTRATHHVLRGDLTVALRYNMLVVVVLAAIAAGWVTWLAATVRKWPTTWVSKVPVWAQVCAGAVLVVFAVVRNLPGVTGLRG